MRHIVSLLAIMLGASSLAAQGDPQCNALPNVDAARA